MYRYREGLVCAMQAKPGKARQGKKKRGGGGEAKILPLTHVLRTRILRVAKKVLKG